MHGLSGLSMHTVSKEKRREEEKSGSVSLVKSSTSMGAFGS